MFKLALLHLFVASFAAMLTWATVKYMEMSFEQRALAGQRPRSRPYATKMPVLLARH